MTYDERKRLAYADRAETLERKEATRDPFIGIDATADRLYGEEMRSASPGPAARSLGCTCISLGTGTSDDGVFEMQHADRCLLRDWRINRRRSAIADGTGRHSRKEMEAQTWKRFTRQCNWCRRIHSFDGDHDDVSRCPGCGAEANPVAYHGEPPTQTVAGVSFTSVPQLCAAYEYALSTLQSLYLLIDLKQHAWQSEQDVMREARTLLLAAGKEVP